MDPNGSLDGGFFVRETGKWWVSRRRDEAGSGGGAGFFLLVGVGLDEGDELLRLHLDRPRSWLWSTFIGGTSASWPIRAASTAFFSNTPPLMATFFVSLK